MRLGAIHRPPPAGLHLARLASLEGVPPVRVDWLSACPANGDPLGNDDAGCCVEVAILQTIAIRRAVLWGAGWRPTAADALALYSLLTGYDQATGQPDAGTDTITAMNRWAVHGIQAGPEADVSLWAPLDPQYEPHLAVAINDFGPIEATFALPLAVQDASDWDMPPGKGADWAAGSWGYHRVPVGAFERRERRVLSWGRDIAVHPEFWLAYCVGADVPLSREWCNTAGRSPAGLDWNALAAKLKALAA